MTLKAVFFDLDGTLLDTSGDLASALNKLLIEEGKPPLLLESIRPQVSNGSPGMLKIGFNLGRDDPAFPKFRERFLEHYQSNIAEHTRAFEAIPELIEACRDNGLSWGIVTNKPSLYTELLMRQVRFASEPIATVCPDHVGIAKPDPAPLLHACKIARCTPKECVYIGDNIRDIDCGKNAGVDTIAVGYGFTETPTEHLTWGATHNVDQASQIWPILKSYLR